MHRDGSSFTWHQPRNNQTALKVHHFDGYLKHTVKGCSRSFRITCNKSAVSVLESRQLCCSRVIDNNSPASCLMIAFYELCLHHSAPLTFAFCSPLTFAFCQPLTFAFCSPLTFAFCSPLTFAFCSPLTFAFGQPLTFAFCSSLTFAFCSPLTFAFCFQ